jgi:hypothetical protein
MQIVTAYSGTPVPWAYENTVYFSDIKQGAETSTVGIPTSEVVSRIKAVFAARGPSFSSAPQQIDIEDATTDPLFYGDSAAASPRCFDWADAGVRGAGFLTGIPGTCMYHYPYPPSYFGLADRTRVRRMNAMIKGLYKQLGCAPSAAVVSAYSSPSFSLASLVAVMPSLLEVCFELELPLCLMISSFEQGTGTVYTAGEMTSLLDQITPKAKAIDYLHLWAPRAGGGLAPTWASVAAQAWAPVFQSRFPAASF